MSEWNVDEVTGIELKPHTTRKRGADGRFRSWVHMEDPIQNEGPGIAYIKLPRRFRIPIIRRYYFRKLRKRIECDLSGQLMRY